jgi:hypothetical protein
MSLLGRLVFLTNRGRYRGNGRFFFLGGYFGFPDVLTLVVFWKPVFYAETPLTELALEREMDFLATSQALHQFLGSPPRRITQFISIESFIRLFLKLMRKKFAIENCFLVLLMKKDKCLKSVAYLVAGVKRIGCRKWLMTLSQQVLWRLYLGVPTVSG